MKELHYETVTIKAMINIWDDIPRLTSNSKEYTNHFSQKPSVLLKRIINMSTEEVM